MNTTEPSEEPTLLQQALEKLIKTATMEEAQQLIEQYPELLTDRADLFISTIMDSALKQGHEQVAHALGERRDFLRSVRSEQKPH